MTKSKSIIGASDKKAPSPPRRESGRTLFFDGLMSALKAAAPSGSTVRAVGLDDIEQLLRAGYRVNDGAADVCIARGGEREFALARKTDCTELILVPTHAYFAAAVERYRVEEHAFAVMRRGKKPFAAVFDGCDMIVDLASVFAETVTLELAAFDFWFGACMRGERVDARVCREAAALVTELTGELRSLGKDRDRTSAALISASKRAARLVEDTPGLLHASGAAQVCEALRMLATAEERRVGLRAETEMIVEAYVLDYYIKSLTRSEPFCPPPDNSKRIDSVCEYFGTDVRRACVFAAPLFSPQKLRLYEYRINEFRSDLLKMLVEVNNRYTAAWQVFKRLYPDDGYSLKTMVDTTDIPLCLALAPDVFAADSMLSFLKQTGRLERYIV